MPKVLAPFVLLLFPALGLAQTLALVNGEPITEAMVLAANSAAQSDPQAREQTLDTLVSRALLAQRAAKAEWLNQERFKAALATQRLDLLANAEAQHYWDTHPITEKQIQAAYDKAVARLPKREYRLREIIVADLSQARALLASLRQGASFSDLAAEHSLDANGAIGGEMGWVADTSLPAPFIRWVTTAKPGEVIGPINVPQGWAIIQLLGERATPKPTLASVRSQLEAELRNEALQSYVARLKDSAHIVLHTEGADHALAQPKP